MDLARIDPERSDQVFAGLGESVVVTIDGPKGPNRQQPVAELDAAPAGEVVVAGASLGEGGRIATLPQRADRHRRRDLGQRLEHGCDVRPGELVVAMAALRALAHQAAVDEPAQVRRGGRRTDACASSQFPGGERPAVGQRDEHRRPGSIAEEPGRRGEVQVPWARLGHVHRLTHAHFGACQSVFALVSTAFSSDQTSGGPMREQSDEHRRSTGSTGDIDRIFHAWDEALGAKDVDAAISLYAPHATLESPLVSYLLDADAGVVEGREALRRFVERVFAHQPPQRGRSRTGYLSDGTRLTWEYPRASSDGEQMDIVEVMDIDDRLIQHHRVYWGWYSVAMLRRGEHPR